MSLERRGRQSVARAAVLTLLVACSGLLAFGITPVMAAGSLNADDDADFAPAPERSPTPLQERRLVQGLIDLGLGRMDAALSNMSGLVREQPDFKLAQTVYADLLLAHVVPLEGFGQRLDYGTVDEHREEARARLRRYLAAPPPRAVPANVLKLPANVPAAIVVDLERYRLYLIEHRDDRVQRTRDFYVSIGKGGADKRREGDEKTPVGVYRVSEFLPGESLPDLYGVGAYPIDYPNGWDRLKGRTGSGIWIHGTESDQYSRSPLSSRGCVTLSNQDFEALERRVSVDRTPVVVADRLHWVDRDQATRERQELEGAVESWRQAWESRDSGSYLAHYSADFRTGKMDRATFAAHKRRVNAQKTFIQVNLDDVGIFRYPGEQDLVVISFLQRYKSDNFERSKRKRQYWRQERGQWRIVYEETV